MKNMCDKKYPDWICSDCGDKYGNSKCGIASFHIDKCDICSKETLVTEPRDYGYLKDSCKKDITNYCDVNCPPSKTNYDQKNE